MTPALRRRVDELVLTAAMHEGSWASSLAELADEPEVIEEVRRRLRAAEALPESFLLAPATDILEAMLEGGAGSEEPDVPADDDRYELGECLGTGGMARVFKAFDRKLGRPVALKLIDAVASQARHGPLREARAQARVRHEHVLDVYETGELGGTPFIALRYVAGGTLAAGPVLERASVEQKVRLLAQAADGLHAAHREGLLHGDVKPSNVLVEETPEGELKAWIGDFGIATEVDSPRAEAAALAGTPAFMAPELLRADRPTPDRRADVYGLGATLYQVLVGEAPPRGDVRWRLLRERAPHLPPDLAAIVARCMAEDPAARYPSAVAVAADLRRFLDGDVVEAYADRVLYRWTSFATRHRTLLTVAAIGVALLGVASAVAAFLGVRAVRANERADARRHQAEDLIGFMLVDLRDKLESVGRLDLLDDVGHRALRYFAAVPERELSNAELARRSLALHQIGEVRIRRGDLEGAQEPLAQSLALARRLAARDPGNPERLFGLGQSEFWMGYALWERGDLTGASPHLQSYLEISQRLVAIDGRNEGWRRELAYANSNLGSLLQERGDLEGALSRFATTLRIDGELVAAAPRQKVDDERFELAATHNTMGVVLEQLGRLGEAQEQYEADLALRRELATRAPDNYRWQAFLATSHQYLGNLLAARGQAATARSHLETTRDLFVALSARDRENREWAYQAAWSQVWLGRVLHEAGATQRAREAWRDAEAIAGDLVAFDSKRAEWRRLRAVAHLHVGLGMASSDPEAARRAAQAAIDLLAPLLSEQRGRRWASRWLAEALLLRGELERAREALAPLIDAQTRDHELLVPWLRTMERLGRAEETSRARSVLREIGYRRASDGR